MQLHIDQSRSRSDWWSSYLWDLIWLICDINLHRYPACMEVVLGLSFEPFQFLDLDWFGHLDLSHTVLLSADQTIIMTSQIRMWGTWSWSVRCWRRVCLITTSLAIIVIPLANISLVIIIISLIIFSFISLTVISLVSIISLTVISLVIMFATSSTSHSSEPSWDAIHIS